LYCFISSLVCSWHWLGCDLPRTDTKFISVLLPWARMNDVREHASSKKGSWARGLVASILVQAENICLALLTIVANVDPGTCIRWARFESILHLTYICEFLCRSPFPSPIVNMTAQKMKRSALPSFAPPIPHVPIGYIGHKIRLRPSPDLTQSLPFQEDTVYIIYSCSSRKEVRVHIYIR
jgi:hypothetical protein